MTVSVLVAALLLNVVPPPRPPQEPLPPAPQARVILTATDVRGPRPGVLLQLFRLGPGGRALPLSNRPTLVRSGPDGIATLKIAVTAPLLVQLSDPERNILVRLPLRGEEVIRVGAATFRLQVSAVPSDR